MPTERQVVSVSLTQQQSEFLKTRPEGQSQFIQNLINEYIGKDALEKAGIPILPTALEKYIVAEAETAVRTDGNSPTHNTFSWTPGPVPEMCLSIFQEGGHGLNAWLVCRMTLNGIKDANANMYKLRVNLHSNAVPCGEYSIIHTKSDTYEFWIRPGSGIEKTFFGLKDKLYPDGNICFDSKHDSHVDIDNTGDAIYRSRFRLVAYSPMDKSVWNLPELSLYVSKIEFGEHDDLFITFINTNTFCLHKFCKVDKHECMTTACYVTLDISSYDWKLGTLVETTRYNVWVSCRIPTRSSLMYNSSEGNPVTTTTVHCFIVDSGDPGEICMVTGEDTANARKNISKFTYDNELGMSRGLYWNNRREDINSKKIDHYSHETVENLGGYCIFSDSDKARILSAIDNADQEKSVIIRSNNGMQPYKGSFYISEREYLYIEVNRLYDVPQGAPNIIVKTSWTTTMTENDVIKHQTWWRGENIGWLTDRLDELQICEQEMFPSAEEIDIVNPHLADELAKALSLQHSDENKRADLLTASGLK